MAKPMRNFDRRGQSGFAFLWVLLAVAMLGLLMATAADVVSVQQRRDRELELLYVGREFRTALRQYHDCVKCGETQDYPRTLDDLLRDPRSAAAGQRYLRKIYFDPMTGSRDWGVVRSGSGIVGVYSKSTARPLMQRGFDGEEMGFNDSTSYAAWVFAPQVVTAQR